LSGSEVHLVLFNLAIIYSRVTTSSRPSRPSPTSIYAAAIQVLCWTAVLSARDIGDALEYKKLSYRRETARQLLTSFSVRALIVQFTEHCICCTAI